MRKNYIFVLIIFSFICISEKAEANNLNISNVAVASQSSSADTLTLQFDISWSNSWYDSINKDAVWVFVKYSTDAGSSWNHATMKTSGTNPSGFSQGSGTALDIVVSSDKKGCFIQRSSQGSGSVSTTSMQIVWDYGVDGVSDSLAASPNTLFKIFGIEMVYVTQGGFITGNANDGSNTGQAYFEYGGSSGSRGGPIDSEGALNFGNSAFIFYYNSASNSGESAAGGSFELSAAFPKGFNAIYCMKYEITEGQWVSFFNTLTSAQKTNRDITGATGKNSDSTTSRNTVAWTSGDATTTRSDRACSYLSWMDVCAYLDWAALRPMTEFEYEKICRGPIAVTSNEYAWGTTSATAAATISGSEDGTETISTANANLIYNNTTFTGGDASSGPLRVGIFATSSSTTRLGTGASYYGIMELSGNLWERTVTVGNTTGRSYSGTHGDGVLTTTSSYEGNATNLDWPGIDSTINRGVTGGTGGGFRGGSWKETTTNNLIVANRIYAAKTDTTRANDYGGRGVRTA